MTQTATLPALEELQHVDQWLGWRYHPVTGKDKPTKKPHNSRTGVQDNSNVDPAKWVSHQEALAAQETFLFDGIGIACSKDDPYTYGDLDGCLPDGKTLTPYGRYVVEMVDSYFEITPSGTGLRFIVRGKLGFNLGADIKGDGDCKLELKESGGYVTITGNHWPGSRETIEERTTELELLAEEARNRRNATRRGSAKQQKKPKEPVNNINTPGDTPYGLSALADECHDLATTPEGGRNTRLNLAAFRLAQLVAGEELTSGTVEHDLLAAADRAGLDSSEALATFTSGFAAGLREPRSAPRFERLHHAMDTPDEDAPDLDALTLENAKKLILSLRRENQQLKQEKSWWNTIMANPNLKTVQKLMIRQRIDIEQNTDPGKKKDGKLWWRIDMQVDGEATGSDAGTISRNVPYLVAGGVLETWEQPIELKNGRKTHLVWGRLTGAEQLPDKIVVPSKWGGKPDRCECGGEFKIKSRVIRRQRVGTCKKCKKVRVFAAEDVKSELPITKINLDDEPAHEAHADDYPLHDATVPEEESSPSLQDATYWPERADCTLVDDVDDVDEPFAVNETVRYKGETLLIFRVNPQWILAEGKNRRVVRIESEHFSVIKRGKLHKPSP